MRSRVRHMHRQWDKVLNFLVGSPNVEMSEKVEDFLLRAGLMIPGTRDDSDHDDDDEEDRDGDFVQTGLPLHSSSSSSSSSASSSMSSSIHISSQGYEFLLQDIHLQMWRFAQEYIQTSANNSTDAPRFSAETVTLSTSSPERRHRNGGVGAVVSAACFQKAVMVWKRRRRERRKRMKMMQNTRRERSQSEGHRELCVCVSVCVVVFMRRERESAME